MPGDLNNAIENINAELLKKMFDALIIFFPTRV